MVVTLLLSARAVWPPYSRVKQNLFNTTIQI